MLRSAPIGYPPDGQNQKRSPPFTGQPDAVPSGLKIPSTNESNIVGSGSWSHSSALVPNFGSCIATQVPSTQLSVSQLLQQASPISPSHGAPLSVLPRILPSIPPPAFPRPSRYDQRYCRSPSDATEPTPTIACVSSPPRIPDVFSVSSIDQALCAVKSPRCAAPRPARIAQTPPFRPASSSAEGTLLRYKSPSCLSSSRRRHEGTNSCFCGSSDPSVVFLTPLEVVTEMTPRRAISTSDERNDVAGAQTPSPGFSVCRRSYQLCPFAEDPAEFRLENTQRLTRGDITVVLVPVRWGKGHSKFHLATASSARRIPSHLGGTQPHQFEVYYTSNKLPLAIPPPTPVTRQRFLPSAARKEATPSPLSSNGRFADHQHRIRRSPSSPPPTYRRSPSQGGDETGEDRAPQRQETLLPIVCRFMAYPPRLEFSAPLSVFDDLPACDLRCIYSNCLVFRKHRDDWQQAISEAIMQLQPEDPCSTTKCSQQVPYETRRNNLAGFAPCRVATVNPSNDHPDTVAACGSLVLEHFQSEAAARLRPAASLSPVTPQAFESAILTSARGDSNLCQRAPTFDSRQCASLSQGSLQQPRVWPTKVPCSLCPQLRAQLLFSQCLLAHPDFSAKDWNLYSSRAPETIPSLPLASFSCLNSQKPASGVASGGTTATAVASGPSGSHPTNLAEPSAGTLSLSASANNNRNSTWCPSACSQSQCTPSPEGCSAAVTPGDASCDLSTSKFQPACQELVATKLSNQEPLDNCGDGLVFARLAHLRQCLSHLVRQAARDLEARTQPRSALLEKSSPSKFGKIPQDFPPRQQLTVPNELASEQLKAAPHEIKRDSSSPRALTGGEPETTTTAGATLADDSEHVASPPSRRGTSIGSSPSDPLPVLAASLSYPSNLTNSPPARSPLSRNPLANSPQQQWQEPQQHTRPAERHTFCVPVFLHVGIDGQLCALESPTNPLGRSLFSLLNFNLVTHLAAQRRKDQVAVPIMPQGRGDDVGSEQSGPGVSVKLVNLAPTSREFAVEIIRSSLDQLNWKPSIEGIVSESLPTSTGTCKSAAPPAATTIGRRLPVLSVFAGGYEPEDDGPFTFEFSGSHSEDPPAIENLTTGSYTKQAIAGCGDDVSTTAAVAAGGPRRRRHSRKRGIGVLSQKAPTPAVIDSELHCQGVLNICYSSLHSPTHAVPNRTAIQAASPESQIGTQRSPAESRAAASDGDPTTPRRLASEIAERLQPWPWGIRWGLARPQSDEVGLWLVRVPIDASTTERRQVSIHSATAKDLQTGLEQALELRLSCAQDAATRIALRHIPPEPAKVEWVSGDPPANTGRGNRGDNKKKRSNTVMDEGHSRQLTHCWRAGDCVFPVDWAAMATGRYTVDCLVRTAWQQAVRYNSRLKQPGGAPFAGVRKRHRESAAATLQLPNPSLSKLVPAVTSSGFASAALVTDPTAVIFRRTAPGFGGRGRGNRDRGPRSSCPGGRHKRSRQSSVAEESDLTIDSQPRAAPQTKSFSMSEHMEEPPPPSSAQMAVGQPGPVPMAEDSDTAVIMPESKRQRCSGRSTVQRHPSTRSSSCEEAAATHSITGQPGFTTLAETEMQAVAQSLRPYPKGIIWARTTIRWFAVYTDPAHLPSAQAGQNSNTQPAEEDTTTTATKTAPLAPTRKAKKRFKTFDPKRFDGDCYNAFKAATEFLEGLPQGCVG